MPTNRFSANNGGRLYFIGSFLLTSSVNSAIISGLNYTNRFIPSFNDEDDGSIDIGLLFLILSGISFGLSLGAGIRIRQNSDTTAVSRSAANVQVGLPQQAPASENAPLLPSNRNNLGLRSKFVWSFSGSLISAGVFLGFLHYARHIAENNHKLSNDALKNGLILATVGLAVTAVLMAVFVLCSRNNNGQVQSESSGCWARLTSCCRSDAQPAQSTQSTSPFVV